MGDGRTVLDHQNTLATHRIFTVQSHRRSGSYQGGVRIERLHRFDKRLHVQTGRGIAIGKHHLIDGLTPANIHQIDLIDDRDAARMAGTRELGRVSPAADSGDLGRGEGDDLEAPITAVNGVEVMEIAARGAMMTIRAGDLLFFTALLPIPLPLPGQASCSCFSRYSSSALWTSAI